MKTRHDWRFGVLTTLVSGPVASVALAQQVQSLAPQKLAIQIAQQPVAQALTVLGEQSGLTIIVASTLSRGVVSPAIGGVLTADEALRQILTPVGLQADYLDSHTVAVRASDRAQNPVKIALNVAGSRELMAAPDGEAELPQPGSEVGSVAADAEDSHGGSVATDRKHLEEVLVTGTHIRGEAPVGTSMEIYSSDDIEKSGASTLEDFARTLPTNSASVDAPTLLAGSSNLQGGSQNAYAGSAFNLLGLGPSSTLTLLNGHRLPGAGSQGAFADISLIPLSAIDRIEVLDGGASAIYGSDAVAGVVNIITRKDFEGAETGVRYGGSTDGGADEFGASQLFGHSWSTGNVFLGYNHDLQGGLLSSKRSFLPADAGENSILPKSRRDSILLDANQQLDDLTKVSLGLAFGNRASSYVVTVPDVIGEDQRLEATQKGVTLGIERSLPHAWAISLTGDYAQIDQNLNLSSIYPVFGFSTTQITSDVSKTYGASLDASGELFGMPGGSTKLALGAAFRHESLDSNSAATLDGTPSGDSADFKKRTVSSGYGELLVPIVGSGNAAPLVRKLEFSLAARFDHYSDFGSTTNPKLGVLWVPGDDLALRGSYGRSFRAPTLRELVVFPYYFTEVVPNPASPTGESDILVNASPGNSNLKPERSTAYTAGIDFHPHWLSNFQVSMNYYHIHYTNRVAAPPLAGPDTDIFFEPQLQPFISPSPGEAQVAEYLSQGGSYDGAGLGPGAVTYVFNEQITNLAAQDVSGVQTSIDYSWTGGIGTLSTKLAANKIIRNSYQSSDLTPPTNLLNVVGEPTSWKGHASVGWAKFGLASTVTLNYVNGYVDNYVSPSEDVSKWITVDWVTSYSVPDRVPHLFQGCTISLNARNVFNKAPPYVPFSVPALPYDATNASAVGRLLSVELRKRW